jgi:hypothetical protein|tara:strand:+ start:419 stop:556 length:138 start_codon:yes stop_codon:yes gene_type:complete
MEWKEVEENLIRLLGPSYYNYPDCVEWNIKLMKYLNRGEEKSNEN